MSKITDDMGFLSRGGLKPEDIFLSEEVKVPGIGWVKLKLSYEALQDYEMNYKNLFSVRTPPISDKEIEEWQESLEWLDELEMKWQESLKDFNPTQLYDSGLSAEDSRFVILDGRKGLEQIFKMA